MSKVVFLDGARTPIGRLSGSLAGFSGTDLGALAIGGALARAGVAPEQVDYVTMGQVLQAGEGQATARQAASKAGIPLSTPATTINKVCLSGINATYVAAQMIQAGDADIVVAGGMESMTAAPYIIPGARAGLRAGDATLVDSMMADGLTCALDHCSMGLSTENALEGFAPLSRSSQDEFAAQSHERAARAQKDGLFDDEIVAVEVPQRKGDPIVFDADEGVRGDTSAESLGKLRPAFSSDGTITAGNASQISDGGSAIVLASADKAAELGLNPRAEFVSYGQVAGPDTSLLLQPANAIRKALARTDYEVEDIDLFELNEAFAAVGLASTANLGVNDDIVNVNGGAIAVGHPIGASGSRIVLTLMGELARRGGGLGAAALCGGGGQGDALLLRVPE
jgi:acetyl-CoA C-acetyltransferase